MHSHRIALFGALLVAGVGCTSLTRSDEIRVSKDKPQPAVSEEVTNEDEEAARAVAPVAAQPGAVQVRQVGGPSAPLRANQAAGAKKG